MIVTIDGPAGAGKSSAAKALAARLCFEFLDTGAMYRAVAFAATRAEVSLTDEAGLNTLLAGLHLEMPPGRLLLNGEDIANQIRTPEMSTGASQVGVSETVRTRLGQWQRAIADGRNMVCEGRDQGTVVFPDAACKFFLTADPEERLRRRAEEMRSKGESVDLEILREIQKDRDERDSKRKLAPLVPAADAVMLDSTALSPEQVVDRMEQVVRSRLAGGIGGEK